LESFTKIPVVAKIGQATMDTLYEDLRPAFFELISTVTRQVFLGAKQIWTEVVEKNETHLISCTLFYGFLDS
jgi:hypothetical protein